MPAMTTFLVFVGIVIGGFVLIAGGNFMIELAEGDTAGEAWRDTNRLMLAIVGAIGGLVASTFVNVGGLLGALGDLIGMSPTALTNGMSIGLGALALSGQITLDTRLYVALTVGFLGAALLITEVNKSA